MARPTRFERVSFAFGGKRPPCARTPLRCSQPSSWNLTFHPKARVKGKHALRLLDREVSVGFRDIVDTPARLLDREQSRRSCGINVQRRHLSSYIGPRVRPTEVPVPKDCSFNRW